MLKALFSHQLQNPREQLCFVFVPGVLLTSDEFGGWSLPAGDFSLNLAKRWT